MRASDRTTARRPAAAWMLRLYPRAWRERYGVELLDILSARRLDARGRFDLLRGALDAHLHPLTAPTWPALAAIAGGAAWSLAGVFVSVQPVPPSWPGYMIDIVPLAMVGVVALVAATVGAWLRLGDGATGTQRIALDLAIAGHLVWLAVLAAALLRIDYGLSTVIGSSAAAIGAIAVGFCLVRANDERIGVLLVITPVALLLTTPLAWLAMGLGWTTIGWLLAPARLGPASA